MRRIPINVDLVIEICEECCVCYGRPVPRCPACEVAAKVMEWLDETEAAEEAERRYAQKWGT